MAIELFPEDHSECTNDFNNCGDADCPFGFHAVIRSLRGNAERKRRERPS
jgi:hypothetical protein